MPSRGERAESRAAARCACGSSSRRCSQPHRLGGPEYQISGKMFDGLVEYDFNFNPTPKLATAWKLSPDAKELTFTLRSDVKWHD